MPSSGFWFYKPFARTVPWVSFLAGLLLLSCSPENPPPRSGESLVNKARLGTPVSLDLEKIKRRGKLIALTRFNANSYFLYRGEPRGFEYELLTRLAEHLGVSLEIVVPEKWGDLVPQLYRGEGDLIAANLTVTRERAQALRFTRHHTETRQVLVQRKPDNWRSLKQHELEQRLLRNPLDLVEKKVVVRKGSAYARRLHNLSDEIGGDILVQTAAGEVETEVLIKKVSDGEIDYTVADENIALINQSYYRNLDVQTPVSFPQRIAWAVRPNAPKLLQAVNQWLQSMTSSKNPAYYVIYNKYYKNKARFRKRLKSRLFTAKTGRVSPYDDLLKRHARTLGWDWRLLAAQVFQESRFDPQEKSWAGAKGLLQLMPKTAKRFGAKDLYDPEQNLKAGTAFIKWLTEYWKDIPDSQQRLHFVLASYNAGQGHVQDARRLAKKYGKDPNRWDGHTAAYLRKKAGKKFFTDPVVRFGYCRGEEPVEYVQDILSTFAHYQQFVE